MAEAETPTPVDPSPPDADLAALQTDEGQAAHLAKTLAATAEGAPEESETPAEPEEGKKVRGKDGKFLPRGKKPEAEEPEPKAAADKPEKPELAKAKPKEEKPSGEESPGALAKFRRLLNQGKVDEACALAGIDPERFEFNSTAWKEVRGVLKAERAEIRAQAQAVADDKAATQRAATDLIPVLQARKAYRTGNYDQAIQLLGGDTLETFLRKVAATMHGAPQRDPQVDAELAQTRREVAELRAERQRERDAAEQQAKKDQLAAQEAQYMTDLAEELGELEPHIAKRASKPIFLQKIAAIQKASYDDRTKTWLPTAVVAAEAYDEIYGDPEEETQASRVAKPGTTQRRGTEATNPAPRDRGEGGRRARTTSHSQAAEAGPLVDDVDIPFDDAEKQQARQARILARLSAMPYQH